MIQYFYALTMAALASVMTVPATANDATVVAGSEAGGSQRCAMWR